MSDSRTPPSPQPASGADPSMEDILASIRRILSEEESAVPPPKPEAEPEDDVLVLDNSMMVANPGPEPEPVIDMEPAPVAQPVAEAVAEPARDPVAPEALLAPTAAASVGGLLRALANERATQVHRGGPTIEDLVREELRPLLKDWLDNHLPPLVERLVRAEIERVSGRAGP